MINVIGAGPVGGYFAYLCEQGVMIFEEHDAIGKPVACTGIMTKRIFDLVKLDKKVIVNELDKVRVVGGSKEVEFKLNEKEIVVDRERFDRFLLDKAVDKGVKLVLGHRFIGCKNNQAVFRVKNALKRYEYDALVGADGPGSLVGREAGLLGGRKYLVGKQYRVKMKNEADVFSVYLGDVHGFFGWVVPENSEVARLGVASERFAGMYLEMLMKRLGLEKKEIIECQSGLIPVYDGGRCCRNNVYLIGDAGGHVKATSIDFEEPIIYEKDGLIRTGRIGEIVDYFMNINKKDINYVAGHVPQEILRIKSVNAYSPDKQVFKPLFRNVKYLIRHKLEENLYEIILDKGYRVKVTGSHSVMVLGDKSIDSKKVVKLDKDKDLMLVTMDAPKPKKLVQEINLIRYMLRECPELVQFVRVKKGRLYLYSKSTEIDERHRSSYWGMDSIPLAKFIEKKIKLRDVGISYETGKNIVIPNIVKMTPEFLRLLGYYVAEGSTGNGRITLSFGKKDKEYGVIDDAIHCIESCFKIKANKIGEKLNPSTGQIAAYSICFGGKLLSRIFSELLGAGSGAKNKGIPFVVFNVNNNLKFEFLKGLIRGDGYIRIRNGKLRRNWSAEISIKSVSRKLASDLVILSFQLGLVPNVEQQITPERRLYGKKISTSYGFKITYSSSHDLLNLIDIFPEKKDILKRHLSLISGKKASYGLPRRVLGEEVLYILKKDLKKEFGNFRNYFSYSYDRIQNILKRNRYRHAKIDFLYNLVRSNIGVFSIKEIRKIKPSRHYVYDVEIPETQMFVGGIGPILLHNTGGGLVYGLRGARCLARALDNNMDYEKLWRRDFGKELWLHLKIREFLNKLDKGDYDELLTALKGVDIGGYNRDRPFRNLGMFVKPGLAWFLLKKLVKP